MSIVLVDTDVASFLFKGDSRAKLYAPQLQGHRLAISFMTVAELFQWAAVRNWGTRRIQQLEGKLDDYLIIPVDIELCRLWGQVRAECRAAGQPISPQDAWIAATARRHDLPLATHNVAHFEAVAGLELVKASVEADEDD